MYDKYFIMLKFLLTISFIIVAYVASSSVFCDWQLFFQDPASPICEGIINLHHGSMFLLIVIVVFVLMLICNKVLPEADLKIVKNGSYKDFYLDANVFVCILIVTNTHCNVSVCRY